MTSRLKWVVVRVETWCSQAQKRHVDGKCSLTGGLQAAETADAVIWQIAESFSRRHFTRDPFGAKTFQFCLPRRGVSKIAQRQVRLARFGRTSKDARRYPARLDETTDRFGRCWSMMVAETNA